ncbi:hypothetical protein ACO0LG_26725 [Undibacterium sp. Ji42W]
MGALLAVVYPEVVKSGFRRVKDDDVGAAGNVEKIVSPLAHSAVLIIVLVALGPLFSSIKTFFPYDVILKTLQSTSVVIALGIMFGLLCTLSLWQIYILIRVLLPLDVLQINTQSRQLREKARAGLRPVKTMDK